MEIKFKGKLFANNIGVDSGCILIASPDYYKEHTKFKELREDLGVVITDIPNGKYAVTCTIADSWNGKIEEKGEIEVAGNTLLVCDPCYVVDGTQDVWLKFLAETDYLEKPYQGAMAITSMGGDGVYKLKLQFVKI
jgi:hypothetical protein